MTDAQRYLDELRATIERETLRYRSLESALGWCDATREDAIRALTAFELDKLANVDAPLMLVAMLRSDLAAAIRHARRAGTVSKNLGLPTEKLAGALVHLRAVVDALPKDLPKPKRR